ncbi:hypothetical protein [Pontivivens ytuae]|uniref:Lipoprotein n=1 Tax=Pontivivens ytuae TaxID=2789856 RepID=A0A7S9QB94_9RHOB|nr:hypothetical protein [Pontivivens ytuae]QPH52953.1 hypothetical protein I0K15_14205 [Pontivivens ytuae]
MPIFERAAALALIGLLAACDVPVEEARAPLPLVEAETVEVEVGGRSVRLAPPEGLCIDPASVSVSDRGAALLAGDCEAAGVVRVSQAPPIASVLTASIGAAPLPGEGGVDRRAEALEEALQAGLADALLAEADGVARLIETRLIDGTVYALLEDGTAQAFAGAAPRYWRAVGEENGRMILLTVRGLEGAWPGEGPLFDQLAAFRAAIARANGSAA